jgi:hypothetical protein
MVNAAAAYIPKDPEYKKYATAASQCRRNPKPPCRAFNWSIIRRQRHDSFANINLRNQPPAYGRVCGMLKKFQKNNITIITAPSLWTAHPWFQAIARSVQWA